MFIQLINKCSWSPYIDTTEAKNRGIFWKISVRNAYKIKKDEFLKIMDFALKGTEMGTSKGIKP